MPVLDQPIASDASTKSSTPPVLDGRRGLFDDWHKQGSELEGKSILEVNELSPTTPTYVVNNLPPPPLDGFRTLLADWKREVAKTRMEGTGMEETGAEEIGVEGTGMEGIGVKERILANYQQDTAKDAVYTGYQKMATQEDNELVTRWNETLNILLTFAGLLSGIITAFLLASQPDLEVKSSELTNQILLHIARQLDNTTHISQFAAGPAGSATTVRILGYWHASLGCSLLSALGSLLSKQWVLHYQSTPGWANSLEQQCHLREIRAYGLSKWRMHAIMESLPILLQLAVVLFYLGVAESVHSVPALFQITVTSAIVIVMLYVFTLVSGAFFPSCPFRSPVTDVFYQAVGLLIFLARVCLDTSRCLILACFGSTPSPSLADLGKSIESGWRRCLNPTRDSPSHYGERKLSQEPQGAAGVMFWWLQESGWDIEESGQSSEESTLLKMQVVASIIRATPAESACKMAVWRGGFGSWCNEVFTGLLGGTYPSLLALLEADVVYHLMHHSKEGNQAVRKGLIEYGNEIDPLQTPAHACSSFRKHLADPFKKPTELGPLPIKYMDPSALSAYMRLQLIDWSYAKPASRSNRKLLLQELPIALKPDYFPNTPQYFDSIIDAVSLVAIALLPEGDHPEVKPVQGLINSAQLERLFQAIHRLACYKPAANHAHNQLVSLAITAAAKVLIAKVERVRHDGPLELFQYASWESGEFTRSLYRLLSLGRKWWHSQAGTSDSTHGASLVHATHLLLDKVVFWGVDKYRSRHPKWLCPTQADFEGVLATYAHPDAPQSPSLEHDTEATGLLDFVFSLRYIEPSLSTPDSLPFTSKPQFTANIAEYPQVIRQLIHNLANAPRYSRLSLASLSVVIKGREMFLPAEVGARFPDLVSTIEHLASEISQTELWFAEMPVRLYETFNQWDKLLQALEVLQQLVRHTVHQDRGAGYSGEISCPGVLLDELPTTTKGLWQQLPYIDHSSSSFSNDLPS